MKKKKKRLKSLSVLLKDTQTIFNKFIRIRDCLITTNSKIFCKCISCGITKNFDEIQAGHFRAVKMSSKNRFTEKNVNGQCSGCNCFQHGNLANYTININKKWGDGTAEGFLYDHDIKQWKRWELEEIIEKYTKKIDLLNDEDWFKAHILDKLKIELKN